jgi:CheY-like chemotaxis protein
MTVESDAKPIEVLLVEDDPADVGVTEETLKNASRPTSITVAEDGETALAHLRREGEHESSSRPDLILLDLKLPGMDGWEVLEQVSGDPDLVTIPVMLLTGTEAERGRLEAYNVPPSRYCRKPLELDRFDRMVDQLDELSRRPILSPSVAPGPEVQSAGPAGNGKKWWWPFG